MKKLYVLFLAAVMVLGLGAATMAMDFSTYFGGCASYTLGFAGDAWSLGMDDWAGGLWGNATGLMWEFYGSAKLADNASLTITLGEWWSPEWPEMDGSAPWEGLYVGASFKLTDIFNLLTVEFTNGNNKAKDAVTPILGGENWFYKGDPIIRVSAPLTDGFNAALSVATDAGELDWMIKGDYSGDALKVNAGYRANGDFAIEGAITAIEGFKLEAGYGDRGGTAYFVKGTFTGIEGLTLGAKYCYTNDYGDYKGYWPQYPTILDGVDRVFEGSFSSAITYYGVTASYQLDALTLSGKVYAIEDGSWYGWADRPWNVEIYPNISGLQYEIGASYKLSDSLLLGGYYRATDSFDTKIVGYADFLFGGATLEGWVASVGGDVAYGLTMSACAW